MTTPVRLYAHAGIVSTPIASGGSNRPNTDSLYLLKQPYEASEILTAGTGSSVSSSLATAPKGTAILSIQLEPSVAIYYEITPDGQELREATTNSPILKSDQLLHFNAGWRISVRELSS